MVRTGKVALALLVLNGLFGLCAPVFQDRAYDAGALNPGDSGITVQVVDVTADVDRDLVLYAISLRNLGTASATQLRQVEIFDGGRVLGSAFNPIGIETGEVTIPVALTLPPRTTQRLYIRVWVAGVGAVSGGESIRLATKFFFISGNVQGESNWIVDGVPEIILKGGFEDIEETLVPAIVLNPSDVATVQFSRWKDRDANTSPIIIRRLKLQNLGSARGPDVGYVRLELAVGNFTETLVFNDLTGWEQSGVTYEFPRGLEITDNAVLSITVKVQISLSAVEGRTIRTRVILEVEENAQFFEQAAASYSIFTIGLGGIDEIRDLSVAPEPPVLNPGEVLSQTLTLQDKDANTFDVEVSSVWIRNAASATAVGGELTAIEIVGPSGRIAVENDQNILASFHTTGVQIYLGRSLIIPDDRQVTISILYHIAQEVVEGHTLQPEVRLFGEETREISGWSPTVVYPKQVNLYPAGLEIVEDLTPRGHTIYSGQRALVQKVRLCDLDQNKANILINPLVIKNLGTATETELVKLEITDATNTVLAQTTNLRNLRTSGVTLSLGQGNVIFDDTEKELLFWLTVAGPERNVNGRTVQLEVSVFHTEGGVGYVRPVRSASVFSLANNRPPVVDFTWSPESPMWGKSVTFTPTVSDPDGDAIAYSRWEFGGAAAPVERNGPPQEVTVSFPQEGAYTVTLTVRDTKGLEAQKTKTVTVSWVVENLPLAAATVYPTQRFVAQKIRLADKDPDTDAVTLSKVKVKNLGTAADTQFVKLEVRQGGENGALLVETTNLTGFKTGLTLTPTANNVISDDGALEIWIWVTLAGPEKTEDNKTLVLETVFTYGEGRATGDTSPLQGPTFTVRFNRPPVVDFTWSPESPTWQDTITFTPQASDPDNDRLVHFEWDFGDRTEKVITTSAQPVQHRYPEGGEFQVTLIVKDEKGLASAKTKTLNVAPRPNQPPTVDFSWEPAQPLVNQTVVFIPQVSDPDRDTPFSYRWEFGPKATPSTSTAERPTVTFAEVGSYTVRLEVTDARGAKGIKEKTITVSTRPVPNVTNISATPPYPAVGQSVTFTATATAPTDDPVRKWKWDFGDGTPPQETEQNSATHVYRTVGIFTVTVQAQNNAGWSAARTIQIVVHPVGVEFGALVLDNPVTGNQCRIQVFAPAGATELKLTILDMAGRPVLLDKPVSVGTFTWDLKDREGRVVPNGLYLFYVTARIEGQIRRTEIGRILVRR